MEDLEKKYSELTYEYSKLRSRYQALRDNYITLKGSYISFDQRLIKKERTIRGLETVIDGLKFRNNQANKRIEILQAEIKNNLGNRTKSAMSSSNQETEKMEILFESTKNNLISISEENENLRKKILVMSSELNKLKEQNKIMSTIKKDHNSYLNHPKDLELEHKNAFRMEAYANELEVCPIPRKTIESLNLSFYSCIFKLYQTLKPLIVKIAKELQKEFRFEYHQIVGLIESGFCRIEEWNKKSIVIKSRIFDLPLLLKPIIHSLSSLICELEFVLNNSSNASQSNSNKFLALLLNCLSQIDSDISTLTHIYSDQNNSHLSFVLEILLSLDNQIKRYVTLIKIPLKFLPTELLWLQDIRKIMLDLQDSIVDAFNIYCIMIEEEIKTIKHFGWWPSTLIHSEKDSENVYSRLIDVQLWSNLSISVKNDQHTNESEDSDSVYLKKRLSEATQMINTLQQQNMQLSFELKEKSLLLSSNCVESSHINATINEIREYMEDNLNQSFCQLQLLTSQVVAFEIDLRNSYLKLKASESSKIQLEKELKRITVNLNNSKQELLSTKTNYEKRLINLTEEMCILRRKLSSPK